MVPVAIIKKEIMLSVVIETCKSSTKETEAGRVLQVRDQPGLTVSSSLPKLVRPNLKKTNHKQIDNEGRGGKERKRKKGRKNSLRSFI